MSDTIISQITFANGHAYDVLAINDDGSLIPLQGQNRKHIDCQFSLDKYNSIDQELVIEGNLDSLKITKTITADGGTAQTEEWTRYNFNLVSLFGRVPVEIVAASDTAPAQYEDRVTLDLAQLTYLEVLQKSQQAMIDLITLSVLEG